MSKCISYDIYETNVVSKCSQYSLNVVIYMELDIFFHIVDVSIFILSKNLIFSLNLPFFASARHTSHFRGHHRRLAAAVHQGGLWGAVSGVLVGGVGVAFLWVEL